MQEIYDAHAGEWGDVDFVVVNLTGFESGMEEMTLGVTLPVIQDDNNADVAEAYGGAKDYFYLIDKAGYPRYIHYSLDIAEDDRDRFLEQIATLDGEAP